MTYLFRRGAHLLWFAVVAAFIQPVSAQQFGNGAMFADGGKTVIFHSFTSGQGSIVELDIHTGEMRNITTDGRLDRWPALSPSQDRLVFISQRMPPWKIYRVNRDGSDLRLLTEEEGAHLGASWSPDGRKIIYSKQNLDAESFAADLWVMDADGRHKIKLIEHAMWPSWNKQNNSVFFTTILDDGNMALAAYDMQTKKRSTLTDGVMNATGAGITPDGRYIYISAVAGDARMLHRIDSDGSGAVNLGIVSQQDSSPRVSPDGRFLLYGYNAGEGTEIYLLNLVTMVSRNLSQEFADAE